jgi:NADPH:quinone reductase
VKNLTVIGFDWSAYAARHPEIVRQSLAALLAWYDEGRLAPHVSQVLPLEEAGAALDLLAARRATGKVVIEIALYSAATRSAAP